MKIKEGFLLRQVAGQTVVLPVGGDLEYADEVTLYRAMEGRRYF